MSGVGFVGDEILDSKWQENLGFLSDARIPNRIPLDQPLNALKIEAKFVLRITVKETSKRT